MYLKLNDVAVLHGDWESKLLNFLLIFIDVIIFSCSGFLLSDSMEMKPVTTRKLRRRPNDPMPLPEKRRKQNPDILLTFNGFFMSSFSYLRQVSSPIGTSPLFSLFKTLNLFQMGWMAEFLSPILNYS